MQFPMPQDAVSALACPRCEASPLTQSGSYILCGFCDCRFGISQDVPVLVPDARALPRKPPSQEFVEKMAAVYGLPREEGVFTRVRDIFSSAWAFTDLGIQVESAQFVDRVRADRAEVPVLDQDSPPPPPATPAGNACSARRCRWLLDYIPRVLGRKQQHFWNVRFENMGPAPLKCSGPDPVHLSYCWTGAGGAKHTAAKQTPLPVDIVPGRQVSIPILLEAPPSPGQYLLEIGLMAGGTFLDATRKIEIDVVETPPGDLSGWNQRLLEFDYVHDHKDAIKLGMERLRRTGVARPRIPEIGGNASPMVRDFEGDLFNIDVDVHGMQMGLLANRLYGGSMKFLVCDANALPFPDGSFDAIMIFSSMHHLPDPRASLRHFARKLAPGGIIGVLCEPIGHYFGNSIDPSLLNELKKGVNEQTFSLEEWAAIFRQAGLRDDQVTVDRGSLKAFLTKR